MRRRLPWCLALALAAAVAACGGGAGDDDDDTAPDAGVGGDRPPYCAMAAEATPIGAEAPATITVTGEVQTDGVFGYQELRWSVTRNGADIAFTALDPDNRSIEFQADAPGPYRIALDGSVGDTPCLGYATTVNVADPNANAKTYRLLLVPPPEVPAPPQVQMVTILGGANYDVGDRNLEGGLPISGSLAGPASEPVTGYLRATYASDPVLAIPREVFAGVGGAYALRLLAGNYDVLVVPNGSTVAPQRFTAMPATSLAGTLSIAAADTLTGTVLRSDDSPVAGARVALTIGGVPSTIATTNGAGAFSLLARTGGPTAVTVVVEDGSLPQLDLDAAAGLVAAVGTPIEIRYAGGTGAQVYGFTAVASDGATTVPGATVTFIARSVAGAGAVTPEGGSPLPARGAFTATVVADGAGAVGPVSLPAAVYDVVVAPPLGSSGADASHLVAMDLTGGPVPSTVSLAAPATVTGAVTALAAGDRVTAVPRGLLARAGAPTVESAVGDTGGFSLELVGGGEYDVAIHTAPGINRAPVRLPITAPAPGGTTDLGAIELPEAIEVTGSVDSSFGGGVSGVTVVLLCGDCTGPEAVVPIAETVSGIGGGFTLLAPDPGTSK